MSPFKACVYIYVVVTHSMIFVQPSASFRRVIPLSQHFATLNSL